MAPRAFRAKRQLIPIYCPFPRTVWTGCCNTARLGNNLRRVGVVIDCRDHFLRQSNVKIVASWMWNVHRSVVFEAHFTTVRVFRENRSW